jgi:myo-inositol-1(or 4)-monophosphatase
VIYNPITDELYAARQGQGATLNGRKIAVSNVKTLEDARIAIGFSYRRPVAPHAEAVKALLDAHCEYSRLGSGALGLALTADGRLDGYWEAHINVWDVAAGLCIVKEAGGRVNDFLGEDGIHSGNAVLASTPQLYESLGGLLKISSR